MASFRIQKTRAEISAKGKRKQKAIELAVTEAIERTLRNGAREYKAILASTMPDAEEEAQLLSQGDADIYQGGHATGIVESDVGTPEGGRFLKIGMLSLREAILRSSVTAAVAGRRVVVTTARDAEINATSGFSWATHQRGIQGPTLPFNRNLMQAMNDGGVWEVVPRSGQVLNPEDGVLATRMVKTLQPRNGRQFARAVIEPKVAQSLKRTVLAAMRRVK